MLEHIVMILSAKQEASLHSLWGSCSVSFGKKNAQEDIFLDAITKALADKDIKCSEKDSDMYIRNIDEETLDCLLRLGVE